MVKLQVTKNISDAIIFHEMQIQRLTKWILLSKNNVVFFDYSLRKIIFKCFPTNIFYNQEFGSFNTFSDLS